MAAMSRRMLAPIVAVVAMVAPALAGCEQTAESPDPVKAALTFGVYGTPAEVRAYQEMVDAFNADSDGASVELVSWNSATGLMSAVAGETDRPDVFLAPRGRLPMLMERGITTPLFELLEARNVNTGDQFNHDALLAFSFDDDLQCVPYGVSPMVVYYNTDLIDFDKMRERDLPVADDALEGWSFEEFEAAARFGAKPRREISGLSVEPTLEELAPYLLSGGGAVFNDGSDPTATAFSSDGSRDALARTLALLRDPDVTPPTADLESTTSLDLFKRGRVAMIQGYRSLTPSLRAVEALHFDVMPMPNLGDRATVGSMTGLCVSAGERAEAAADFLVYAIADESVARVAAAGTLVPAILSVARSEAFLQPEQQPASAGVFNVSIDAMRLLPRLHDSALQDAVAPGLEEMLRTPVIVDLEDLTDRIDEASRAVLDPDYEPTPTD